MKIEEHLKDLASWTDTFKSSVDSAMPQIHNLVTGRTKLSSKRASALTIFGKVEQRLEEINKIVAEIKKSLISSS